MSFCPCGSQNPYDQCCGLYLDQKHNPQTPEQLMRSRYTAYSQGNSDYIKNTMKGKALIGFDEAAKKELNQGITWLSLQVIESSITHPNLGYVRFSARYLENNQIKIIEELSEFHKENEIWYYVDGVMPPRVKEPKVGRNNACPCGSGKKFKRCHGA